MLAPGIKGIDDGWSGMAQWAATSLLKALIKAFWLALVMVDW